MWRELIQKLFPVCEFEPPAEQSQILEVETALGVKSPQELKEILLEANGVIGEWGVWYIWKLDRIRTSNLSFRQNLTNNYMPFDHLLFFADVGNGDQFTYGIIAGEIKKSDIYSWYHEDDSRVWEAANLQKYLEKRAKS